MALISQHLWTSPAQFQAHSVFSNKKVKVLITQLCPTHCDPTDCSPWDCPGKNKGVGCHSLLQGIFQPSDWTQVSPTAGRFFTIWATRKAPQINASKIGNWYGHTPAPNTPWLSAPCDLPVYTGPNQEADILQLSGFAHSTSWECWHLAHSFNLGWNLYHSPGCLIKTVLHTDSHHLAPPEIHPRTAATLSLLGHVGHFHHKHESSSDFWTEFPSTSPRTSTIPPGYHGSLSSSASSSLTSGLFKYIKSQVWPEYHRDILPSAEWNRSTTFLVPDNLLLFTESLLQQLHPGVFYFNYTSS